MDRSQEQKQRFSLLVKQMGIPDEWVERFFLDGQIDKLELFKQNKKWVFHFTLPSLLPAQVFQAFMQRLTRSFSHLADVDATFRYRQTPPLDMVIEEYWGILLTRLEPSLNSLAVTMRNARKQVELQEVKVYLPTEMTVEMVKRKKADSELIAAFEQTTGCLPRFSFHAEESDEAYKAFAEQRDEEERALVEVVMTAVQQDRESKNGDKAEAITSMMIGYEIKDAPIPIQEIQEEERRVTIQGAVFNVELKELRSGRHLLTFCVTDYTDSLTVKIFSRDKEDVKMLEVLKDGMWVKVRGSVQHDTFIRELVMNANDLNQIEQVIRKDKAEQKRVELHCHTPMSAMDAVASVKSLVSTAAKWGHPAIAITDHGVVQAFPEAYSVAKKNNIKCILGMEAYVVEDGIDIVYNLTQESNRLIDEHTEYVVFDTETTGLNAAEHTIIEIAAVKMKGSEIVDQWTELIDPKLEIGPKTTEITGITNEMLRGKETLDVVLRKFKDFTGDAILVAHNAEFDKAFINACAKRIGMEPWNNPFLDTLPLARMMYKGMRNYRLGTLAKKFNVELVNAHRALDDTIALAHVFQQMLKDIREASIQSLAELNEKSNEEADYKSSRPFHATILVRNNEGLKNLYKLVSRSHVETFYRWPRIQRSQLNKHREGLLIGTACKEGELMQAILRGKSPEELKEVASYYDFLELQPVSQYSPLLRNEEIPSLETMKGYHRMIVDLGKELDKPVVATGDVHFLNPEDHIFRDVFLLSKGDPTAGNQPPLFLHTTDEMLEAFS
ncbi:MAG TPA: exonuclease domain-containing protein, partial [Brevibacillus sp.]|nr:exonuclease domain-containing protein [Brevibacillus sp.]